MGNRIKELRRIHHLTQDQLGELCGAGKSAVSQWEKNLTQPTLTNILALRDQLGFSIDWLVTGEGNTIAGDMRSQRLVEIYGALDERGRAAVFRVAEAESEYTVPVRNLPKRSG